jgi:hypothetical protein
MLNELIMEPKVNILLLFLDKKKRKRKKNKKKKKKKRTLKYARYVLCHLYFIKG